MPPSLTSCIRNGQNFQSVQTILGNAGYNLHGKHILYSMGNFNLFDGKFLVVCLKIPRIVIDCILCVN